MTGFLNIDYRQVGAMRFLKVGRLNVSWSVSAEFRPIGADTAIRAERRQSAKVAAKRRVSMAYFKGYMARARLES